MRFVLRRVKRIGRMDRRQWALLVRAAVVLAEARLRLARGSFPGALSFGAVPLAGRAGASGAEAIVWAVRAAARRVPFRAMCIEQGIAAQRMMRMAGIDARLHYGARREPDRDGVAAHVWVSVDGRLVIGGEQAQEFAELARIP